RGATQRGGARRRPGFGWPDGGQRRARCRGAGAMNPVERAARWADARQQRYTPLAFVIGVVKKYGDDNGGVLVANLAYSCFISLFPLLLVLVTIVGLVAASDPAFRAAVHDAVASQFPLIGQQLTGNVHQLRRSSVIGLIAGLAAAVWGSTGPAQAGLVSLGQGGDPARPGYGPRLGRAVEFLGVLGLGVIVTTLLASLGTYGHHGALVAALAEAAAVAANVGMYVAAFRVLTPKAVPGGALLPGAVAGAVAWTLLQVPRQLPGAPFRAQRLGLRRVRDRARPGGPDLPGRRGHRVRRRDQRGAGQEAVAAGHRAAAAHRTGPDRTG